MPGETIAARAQMWLLPGMYLCMPFEIVLSHKSLVAMVAAPLTVAEVGLNMRTDILLASKQFVAAVICAHVSVILQWACDIRGNFIFCDTGLLINSIDVS